MHYVIGDVHGCFDEMQQLIKKIEESDKDATIYFVGDLVDRGPKVKEVLDWALENITSDGKYQCVKGNHEDMIIDWYNDCYLNWKRQHADGQSMPCTNYDFSQVVEDHKLDESGLLDCYINFMESLPLYKKIDIDGRHYVVVHACYDSKCDEQDPDYCLWERNLFGYIDDNLVVVHGHTPTVLEDFLIKGDRPGMIMYRDHDINVDGGCVFHKYRPNYPCFLCAICLETMEEIYNTSLSDRLGNKLACWQYEKLYLDG